MYETAGSHPVDDELSTGFFRPKSYTRKTVSVHVMKEYGGSTGIGPLSFNLETWTWYLGEKSASCPDRFACEQKDARYSLNRRLVDPRTSLDVLEK